MVKAYIKAKYAKPAGVYLGIPHRLDRPVSGVVCFARNTKAAQRVHAQFQEHRVRKVYWALVEGDVQPDADTWEDWVRKVQEESRVVRAAEGEPGAKLAMLGYRVLKRLGDATLLELTPLTGRMHQLRVQAAWRGHPGSGRCGLRQHALLRSPCGVAARPRHRAPRPEPDAVPSLHEGRVDLDRRRRRVTGATSVTSPGSSRSGSSSSAARRR